MTSVSRGTLESEVEGDGLDPLTSNMLSLIDRRTVETARWSCMLARPVRQTMLRHASVYISSGQYVSLAASGGCSWSLWILSGGQALCLAGGVGDPAALRRSAHAYTRLRISCVLKSLGESVCRGRIESCQPHALVGVSRKGVLACSSQK
jgi:hypothetical protein